MTSLQLSEKPCVGERAMNPTQFSENESPGSECHSEVAALSTTSSPNPPVARYQAQPQLQRSTGFENYPIRKSE
jgi:hypothetical protein